MYSVYVLRNDKGKYYVGHTQDLTQRLEYHNRGRSNWAGKRGPWTLCYEELYTNRAEAMEREKKLKSWKSKVAIERLIINGKTKGVG